MEEVRTSHDILGAAGVSEPEANLRADLLSQAINDVLGSLKVRLVNGIFLRIYPSLWSYFPNLQFNFTPDANLLILQMKSKRINKKRQQYLKLYLSLPTDSAH